MADNAAVYEAVRKHYAAVASGYVESSACCGTASQVSASGCGCEAGKPVATVINEEGLTVSACCGKPVHAERQSTGACCG